MPPETVAALARQREIVGRMLATISDDVMAAWVRAWYDIERELARIDPNLSARERRRRLEQTRRLASDRILDAAATMNVTLTSNARVLIERGLWEQPELIATQLPPGATINLVRPPGAEVDLMVRRTTEQITARSYALAVEATDVMNRALVLGQSAGDNPRDAARRMIQQAGDAFNGGIARAQVIARTEMIDAHRGAAEASQNANTDVLAGWVWWAQLGPRTCASCIEQHGQLHPLDEPGPLDHHQGRCARVPRTKTWAELGFDVPETRPTVESGLDWFNRQPENVQREVLGPSRFNAWKAGEYPPDAWSVRRSVDGWRDSFHVGKLPPGDWRPGAAAPLAPKGIDWDALTTGPDIGQELNRIMGERGVGTVARGFDIDGLSVEQLRGAARTIEKLTEAYPEVQFDLQIEPVRGRAVAHAMGVPYSKGYMTLNSNFLKEGAGPAVNLAHQRESFWWSLRPEVPDVTTFEYVVAHEFGHLVDYKSGNIRSKGGISAARISKTVARDAGLKQSTPEWNQFLNREICRYGRSSAAEGIAEAFADTWINGEFASETNKRTMAALTAKLRGGN